eukprot:3744450-Prymnesium_polylepis.1
MDGAAPTNCTAVRAAAMRPGPHSCRSLHLRWRPHKRTQGESRLARGEPRSSCARRRGSRDGHKRCHARTCA